MTKQLFQRKESDIQKPIIDYLEILENQGKIYFNRNNSFAGEITRKNGSKGYIKNNKPGTPDIIFCYKGKYIGFETKTESGKQSDLQKIAETKIKKAGGLYFIVRGVSDIINILMQLNIYI